MGNESFRNYVEAAISNAIDHPALAGHLDAYFAGYETKEVAFIRGWVTQAIGVQVTTEQVRWELGQR